jgi:trans-aconitate 2-methyltransferase
VNIHTWKPAEYLRFSSQRMRPALDLLGRVSLEEPSILFDLGCGTGRTSRLLAKCWPKASVFGIDASIEMLDAARAEEEVKNISWMQADLASFSPQEPADLLFSNAALHWLDDHDVLFARWLKSLKEGGVLAVQMPQNFSEPSHTLLRECIRDFSVDYVPRSESVKTKDFYYRLLSPLVRNLDIWETSYLHVLEGKNPVLDWMMGAPLGPVLEVLGEQERTAFLAAYGESLLAAYPKTTSGKTLFPFKRLFLLAER